MPQPLDDDRARGRAPSMTHDDYLGRKYFPELDGLRALAVLIVVSVHMRDAEAWTWLAGRLGVPVFFILSGYLITRLALVEERDQGSLNKRAFFVRRAFRLFPMYYGVLAVYGLLIFGLGVSPEKAAPFRQVLPYYLAYFQEWPFFVGVDGVHQNIPFYQSWTLGIEEKFYLAWPLVAFTLWRQNPSARKWGTLALLLASEVSPDVFGADLGRFLVPYSRILLGCLVAFLLDDAAIFDRAYRFFSRPSVAWGTLASFVGLHFAEPHVSEAAHRWVFAAYALAASGAMVVLILRDGPVQRLLRTRPLLVIGRLSYGIYLVHLLGLNVAEKLARVASGTFAAPAVTLAMTWAVSAAIAYGLAVVVERPCIALGRKLSSGIIQRPRAVRPGRALVAGA